MLSAVRPHFKPHSRVPFHPQARAQSRERRATFNSLHWKKYSRSGSSDSGCANETTWAALMETTQHGQGRDQFSAWTSLHRSALLLISAKMIQNLPGETSRHIFTIKLITAGGFGVLDGNHGCVILFLKVSVTEESILLCSFKGI